MFKEQYIRDNEKLKAKETLLMEIKKQAESQQGAGAKRSRFVRYGAVAAAAVLVLTGVLGVLIHNLNTSDAQSAAPMSAAAQTEPSAAGGAADTANKVLKAEPVESYDELFEMIDGFYGGRRFMMDTGMAVEESADRNDAAADGASTSSAKTTDAPAATAMPVPASAAEPMSEADVCGVADGDYSETNVQVQGVDEADVIKTDGKYIYYVANAQLTIIQADGKDTAIVSATPLAPDEQWWGYASEMFLLGDRLAVIRQGYNMTWIKSEGSSYEQNMPHAEIVLFDVSDPSRPKELATLGQSGDYVSARLIGEYMYVVTSQYVWSPVRSTPSTYVPVLYTDGVAKNMAAGDILAYPTPQNAAFTVIGAINLKSGTSHAASRALFGGTGEIYCNEEHLLLACAADDTEVGEIKPDEKGRNVRITTSSNNTRLTLFGLDDGRITLLSSGTVPGTLLNQFSMDEYKDVFRVVTSVYSWEERVYTDGLDTYEYEDENHNALYTLDQDLNIIGKIEEIAKDEWVESVRFDGDIGYFVTFRRTDPLFAVDLSNPKAPKILSSLKIPGFSEYLHLFGEGKLLGIGYEADENTGRREGVKLTMFDVKNKANVKEITTAMVDADWTVVGDNHHAILVDVGKNLIAFPADNCFYIYGYTDDKGFTEAARINMDRDAWDGNTRGVYIGDNLYVVSASSVTVLSLKTFDRLIKITIAYG